MEVLDTIESVVYFQKNEESEIGKQQFEQMWQSAISGKEFERGAHEHIKKLYALRDKQQANC